MTLAAVRPIGSAKRFSMLSAQELPDFEQELVDQYSLAMVGSGLTDSYIASERDRVFAFVRQLGRPLWTATPDDGDRYLAWVRREWASQIDIAEVVGETEKLRTQVRQLQQLLAEHGIEVPDTVQGAVSATGESK